MLVYKKFKQFRLKLLKPAHAELLELETQALIFRKWWRHMRFKVTLG